MDKEMIVSALEYIAALKDYANAKLPDPGFAIALSMAIDCMSRAETAVTEPLTCNGCTYQADFPSHEKCHGCARSHTDHYRRPPEE